MPSSTNHPSMTSPDAHLETLAVHLGRKVDSTTGAVTPPIVLSTTFARDADGGYARGFVYTRDDNPNRSALENALATLENGAVAVAFSSGNAATSAVLSALRPGDHAIFPADSYYGSRMAAQIAQTQRDIALSLVDMRDPQHVAQAMRPNTRLVWVETPSNPMLHIADIAAIAELAHQHGAWCVCDNTFATPVLQNPLRLGADAVTHATTKYIGGHSDVLGGIVVLRERGELFERVKAYQVFGGAAPSPFDCWLLLRSLATLPLRVRAQSHSAQQVTHFLATHPRVEAVHYPGLSTHPGHATAARQMRGGFGGMVSFQVKGDEAATLAVATRTRLFIHATSLGGVESLIEHRASAEKGSILPRNLLRLSIGLEHADDLIADLAQALDR